MLNFKKLFICFFLSLVLISSCTFATDTSTSENAIMPISEETPVTTTVATSNELNKDLYIYNTDSYSIADRINGNVYASTTKLTINPRNNGGYVSGNIFAIANEFIIESDSIYSNNKDKSGNYIVETTTAKSIIEGNVYALTAENFTLEAGSEIQGDLYIFGTNVNIEQSAHIAGNLYISAEKVNFNGDLDGSAYIFSSNFTMHDYAYIARDLYLNCENATITSLVNRNAYITANNKLITLPDFKVQGNLSVDYANNFIFSGEVLKNANINSKSLTFKNKENDEAIKCSIQGDLTYGSDGEVTIPNGVILGKVSKSDFVNKATDKFSLTNTLIGLATFVVYIFVVVLLTNYIAPNIVKRTTSLTFGNLISSLLAGMISLFAIFVTAIMLLLSGIGSTLSLVLIVAYLFVVAIALPLFMLDIAKILKIKLNIFFRSALAGIVLYLISIIPVLGSSVMLAVFIISIGRILLQIFSRKK